VKNTSERGEDGARIDWASMYREMYSSLVRYLRLKVWDADRAAELAQDVFVRALGTEPRNPRAWLFTIAANLAHDETRLVVRRKKHLALLQREAAVDPPTIDPPQAMDREERAETVRRALDTLNERDREVLLLRDAGLSYPEIAERTGLAVGAVGTTLSRARKRLVEAHASLRDPRGGIPAERDGGRPAAVGSDETRGPRVPGNREGTHAARG
jgi:RNA polymerase sigma-70 factor (ECF subfamily)